MATREIVESDLSGKPDATTVTFNLGGIWYELDLTAEEQQDLEAKLEPYVQVSRKPEPRTPPKRFVPETSPEERDKIREWAKKEGLELSERGRIPQKIQDAFDKAHGIESRNLLPEKSTETAPKNNNHASKIREWAKKEGLEFSERGRIPQKIQDAYDKAHGNTSKQR
ncbi:histone-like nucleoid-structuring protein Lsr2 [Streptomyces acidiscabies]|uniref:Lsr2 family protein n=1 Tax=Streptomyces acidiscabies TaxID=42234 RepID=A0ABU4LWW6_9ACTN|nr:Lsr2 family protein [Streptomyces acidiscabies]MDX3020056.1 Lsr2 family protein [Streptomyces acidiscabies]